MYNSDFWYLRKTDHFFWKSFGAPPLVIYKIPGGIPSGAIISIATRSSDKQWYIICHFFSQILFSPLRLCFWGEGLGMKSLMYSFLKTSNSSPELQLFTTTLQGNYRIFTIQRVPETKRQFIKIYLPFLILRYK